MAERSSAARMYEQQQEMKLSAQRGGATFTTEATTEKPVWAPSTRKLYRASLYWGLGKRAAWTITSAAHKRMEDLPWVTWGGGECPVPCGTLVDVEYRCGEDNHGVPALVRGTSSGSNPDRNATDWTHTNHPRDIVAYRLAVQDAWDYVAHDDLAGVTKPFVNDAALVRAAREQVPALLELGEIDLAILQCEDIQQNALQILGLLEEMYSYGVRRKRTQHGWKFYIKGAQA